MKCKNLKNMLPDEYNDEKYSDTIACTGETCPKHNNKFNINEHCFNIQHFNPEA